MSEEQKKQLKQQLWNKANTPRGKMDADEFRDCILSYYTNDCESLVETPLHGHLLLDTRRLFECLNYEECQNTPVVEPVEWYWFVVKQKGVFKYISLCDIRIANARKRHYQANQGLNNYK